MLDSYRVRYTSINPHITRVPTALRATVPFDAENGSVCAEYQSTDYVAQGTIKRGQLRVLRPEEDRNRVVESFAIKNAPIRRGAATHCFNTALREGDIVELSKVRLAKMSRMETPNSSEIRLVAANTPAPSISLSADGIGSCQQVTDRRSLKVRVDVRNAPPGSRVLIEDLLYEGVSVMGGGRRAAFNVTGDRSRLLLEVACNRPGPFDEIWLVVKQGRGSIVFATHSEGVACECA